MNKPAVKTIPQDKTAERARVEEMERRIKAEGLNLDHPEGKERFERTLDRAAKPKN